MSHSGFPLENVVGKWSPLWLEHIVDYSVFMLSPDGIVLSWNPGGRRIFGHLEEEIVGQHFSILYPKDDLQPGQTKNPLHTAVEHGRVETEGWRIRANGSSFWASEEITALYDPSGSLMGFGAIVRDTSDKQIAYEALKENKQHFRLLVNGLTDYAIYMLSPEGNVIDWNPNAARIMGYATQEVIGMHFSRFYTPEDVAADIPQHGLDITAREGRFETQGWRVRRDGSRFWAHSVIDAIRDEDGDLHGFAKITRDITRQRQADEQLDQTRAALFQSQKMEALGKLTGGVAHDFNNVLQVLRGNLELLMQHLDSDHWSLDHLESALKAVNRGAKLASQLLAFGRRQALKPEVVNLAAIVRDMDDLLRRALGETVELETVVTGGLWNTLVDKHQLQNVALNLAINARDAMPNGGKLTVELANAELDDQYARSESEVVAGQYVMFAITDTGTGMSSEVMQRVFDPFFTTKPEGQGTGLGLSMAFGFVKQSGGHIKLYSELEHGTAVKIYLPRSMEAAIEPQPRQEPVPVGGKETILVVEDDRAVQATVVDTLMQLGYTVLKANDAQDALVIIHSGIHIDLLFTDVVMPGPLRSMEIVLQAAHAFPDLRVLFTSGYTQNAIVHGGRLDPGVELLSKPYSREQLASKVRQMLGTATAIRSGKQTGTELALSPAGQLAITRHILIAEDDSGSRAVTCDILAALGYSVSEVESGEMALERLRQYPFDVLVTDVGLPGISGIELARQAAELHIGLRVIFVSGADVPDEIPLTSAYGTLRKPYTAPQLLQALADLLR